MNQSTTDLGNLFGAALQALSDNRQQLNTMDGHNGNHGDNMVHNLKLIADTLAADQAQPPAKALNHAAGILKQNGRGGTSQYYAQGLSEAAARFQGQSSLNQNDVMSLIQSMLGAVPAHGGPQAQAGQSPRIKPQELKPQAQQPDNPLGDLLGMVTGQAGPQTANQPQAADLLGSLLGGMGGQTQQPQGPASNDLLGSLLGMATGGQPQAPQYAPQPQMGGGDILSSLLGMAAGGGQPQPQQQNNGLDMGDLLNAGMAFLQARQQGADTGSAVLQAAMSAIMGTNPMQAGSSRTAAGGLIAQAMLQGLMGGGRR